MVGRISKCCVLRSGTELVVLQASEGRSSFESQYLAGKIDLEADVIPEIGQIYLLQTFSESGTRVSNRLDRDENGDKIKMSLMKKRIRKVKSTLQ